MQRSSCGWQAASYTPAVRPKTIILDGKPYNWRDLVALRKEQVRAAREITQPALFELQEDQRPKSQKTAAGRLSEPTLFG